MPTLTINRRTLNTPTYRTRPQTELEGFVRYADNDLPITAYVADEVLKKIVAGTEEVAPNEAIGFLAGRAFEDAEGIWILVQLAHVCDHAIRTKVTVNTSEKDLTLVNEWINGEALSMDRLGWWHSHYELRYSSYSCVDRSNQEIWCSLEWQVGLLVLVDNGKVRVRCYQGPQSNSIGELHPVTITNKTIAREDFQENDTFFEETAPQQLVRFTWVQRTLATPINTYKKIVGPFEWITSKLSMAVHIISSAALFTLKRCWLATLIGLQAGLRALIDGKSEEPTPSLPIKLNKPTEDSSLGVDDA